MPVHLCVPCAFGGAGAAECDAVRKLSLEKLPVACLVRPRQDAAGRAANRCAIEIEADALNEVCDIALGKTCVAACGAGFDAAEAGIDAAAHRIGMGGAFGMRAEHGADGNGRHGTFLHVFVSPRPVDEHGPSRLVPNMRCLSRQFCRIRVDADQRSVIWPTLSETNPESHVLCAPVHWQ
jgi:hypothetical protein